MNEAVDVLMQHIQSRVTSELLTAQQSQRIFHGRGKCFAGLEWCNIDYFHPALVLVFYQQATEAIENELRSRLLQYLEEMQECARDSEPKLQYVLVQRRYLHGAPFESWFGGEPEAWFAKRGSLRFHLSLSQQNIGYFLDIEPARCWLETHIASQPEISMKVLNLFAYTCAFSVVAKAAGATSVVNIDLSRKSLTQGRENHLLNRLDVSQVHFLAHDILKSWGKLKKMGPYDIVIIDPPSFQKGSFIAEKDYPKLLKKMDVLLGDKGVFLACLNAPEVLLDDFKQQLELSCPNFTCIDILANHEHFPEAQAGRELKLLVMQKVK